MFFFVYAHIRVVYTEGQVVMLCLFFQGSINDYSQQTNLELLSQSLHQGWPLPWILKEKRSEYFSPFDFIAPLA